MSEKPNRRWFQIHLSTAIVLLFVASGLFWANLRPRFVVWVDSLGSMNVVKRYEFGWPWEWSTVFSKMGVQAHYDANFRPVIPDTLPQSPISETTDHNPCMFAANSLAALLVLAISCICCEYLIRRRIT